MTYGDPNKARLGPTFNRNSTKNRTTGLNFTILVVSKFVTLAL